MRQDFELILGDEVRSLAIQTRNWLDVTQKEMGKRLLMSESSYSDIETGKTVCASALTLLLLLDTQEDSNVFVDRVVERFAKHYEKEMQLTQ